MGHLSVEAFKPCNDMTKKKLRIAVIFGGRSGEHEVSLMSARNVLSALDPVKYDVTQIGITLAGQWLTGEDVIGKFESGKTKELEPAFISPDPSLRGVYVLRNTNYVKLTDVDVYYPVLHGTFGEDGTIQGLFELADAAYVGAGVVGSSVGMDKGVFKDVMHTHNIPSVESIVVLRSEIEKDINAVIEKAEKVSAYPIFTKPANLGSSVGVTKCHTRSDLQEGLLEAALYDRRVLIERGVAHVREIEVSVLGNEEPRASVPGEVLPSREFYSYESKYVDGTSGLVIPAPLPQETTERIQDLAVRAYKAIDAAGMARVDFLLDKDSGMVYLNELNTLPGFTKISMYPKLWEASGMNYTELVDRLIELALQRKAERARISHSYRSQT
jgi:D-alanine-D-alanine ligase